MLYFSRTNEPVQKRSVVVGGYRPKPGFLFFLFFFTISLLLFRVTREREREKESEEKRVGGPKTASSRSTSATPAASNERLSVNAPFPDGEEKEEGKGKKGRAASLLDCTPRPVPLYSRLRVIKTRAMVWTTRSAIGK